jgi:hypothetical protein
MEKRGINEKRIIQFTIHARKRMKEREISEEWVRETIYNPEQINQGEDGETIVHRKFGKTKVRIAYLSLPNEIKVLSAMKEMLRR